VSDKELVRQGPSFTIDTINEFKQEHSPQTRFYFIMGSDAFLDINTWKNKDELFEAVPMIIMLRKGSQNNMASFIDENISKGYTFDEQDHRFVHRTKQEIRICRVPIVDISSTMIRERVKNNAPITGLVPKIVEQTIQTKELYR
jgi:nicotinate-nucleotide adenylyltransferase